MAHPSIDIDEAWYERAFGSMYSVLYAHRTIEAAEADVQFAAKALHLSRRDCVLDLACGNGRHMASLLTKTECVVGLDYSPTLLTVAKRTLGDKGILIRGDMRSLPFVDALDVVVNFFTSFGYFLTDTENEAVLRGIRQSLKPGGRFLIDHLNLAYVEKHLVPCSTRQAGDYTVTDERWLDQSKLRVNKRTVVRMGGDVVGEYQESVQLYASNAFEVVLRRCGLDVVEMYGDMSGASIDPERAGMIVVGRKSVHA